MTLPCHITVHAQPHAGYGIEIGRFRLKSGVSEEEMHAAYRRMVQQHLSEQPGWRGQYLVKLDDGVFVDIAHAESYPQSQAICATWHGQAQCESFLKLIEPESMQFGSLI
ncbi:hypothetical protein [Serratia entomophila]|uniref:hypothetical protein n=1 Tax=Serratia entomophila TaxID=42906 RepID=UPI002179B4AF|nr:hypothetical protein [Serratia entomophila]CAI1074051.1 Uncharacterised protein [Serratia entomophila]CAI1738141.1 Uncharacterised protein [Serratia entomophila]CAI1758937.1 Uncharacterised protein [Serratia entomophila]CAI1812695.1 Uncharacterised protein [Serratia entomophila]CAI1857703.1 Uncharacterised protein [Serratia entomophila]